MNDDALSKKYSKTIPEKNNHDYNSEMIDCLRYIYESLTANIAIMECGFCDFQNNQVQSKFLNSKYLMK